LHEANSGGNRSGEIGYVNINIPIGPPKNKTQSTVSIFGLFLL